MCFLLMHTTGLVRVGKGCRQHMSKLLLQMRYALCKVRPGYVLFELEYCGIFWHYAPIKWPNKSPVRAGVCVCVHGHGK